MVVAQWPTINHPTILPAQLPMQYSEIEEDGTKCWYNKNDQLHRTDGPAVMRPDGTKVWYNNGIIHRKNGPAIIYSSGTKWWCNNGKIHRTNGPAIEWENGRKLWSINDKEMTIPQYYLFNYLCKIQK